MECTKCGATADDSKLYCPQCGHRVQLDPIEGQVMSVEEWKLKKFKEKDQARKDKVEANKGKYDTIKDRMYNQQGGFGVEELEEEVGKKNEETTILKTATTEPVPEEEEQEDEETTPAPEEEQNRNPDDPVTELYDFKAAGKDVKKEEEDPKPKSKDPLLPSLAGLPSEEDKELSEEDGQPKRHRRRKRVVGGEEEQQEEE